jgi:hypothetical protein
MTREEADGVRAKHRSFLDRELEMASSKDANAPIHSNAMFKPLSGTWHEMLWPLDPKLDANQGSSKATAIDPETGVDVSVLKKVGKASVEVTDEFVSNLVNRIFSSPFMKLYQGPASSA